MSAPTSVDEGILGLLTDQRRDAGVPRMGCAEWEIAKLCGGTAALRRLTALRKAGKVNRGGGFVWITEEEFLARAPLCLDCEAAPAMPDRLYCKECWLS